MFKIYCVFEFRQPPEAIFLNIWIHSTLNTVFFVNILNKLLNCQPNDQNNKKCRLQLRAFLIPLAPAPTLSQTFFFIYYWSLINFNYGFQTVIQGNSGPSQQILAPATPAPATPAPVTPAPATLAPVSPATPAPATPAPQHRFGLHYVKQVSTNERGNKKEKLCFLWMYRKQTSRKPGDPRHDPWTWRSGHTHRPKPVSTHSPSRPHPGFSIVKRWAHSPASTHPWSSISLSLLPPTAIRKKRPGWMGGAVLGGGPEGGSELNGGFGLDIKKTQMVWTLR